MHDSFLELKIRSGDISYSPDPVNVYLPDSKALNEALFPDARLPLMYEGRSWREEVYSPFHAPNHPIEALHAEVVSTDAMEYQGKICQVMRVEYRALVGSGVPKDAQLQAVSWVKRDGTVLRHDVFFGDSKLRFERLSHEVSSQIGSDLFERLLESDATIESPNQVPEREPALSDRS
jgi:hypothetical protein